MWHIKEREILEELALNLNACVYTVSVKKLSFGYVAHNPLPYIL